MTNENKETPLNRAILGGDIPAIKRLIDKGADVNARTINGEPANIKIKASKHLIEIIMLYNLLWMPLHLAAKMGRADIALILVNAGADLYAKAMGDKTPFQIATKYKGKDSEIALFLRGAMKKHPNPNQQKADKLLRELE